MDLDNRQLTSIPDNIFKESDVEVLYLGRNFLKELNPKIGKLTNLKALYCDFNFLCDLPEELGLLSNLEKISLTSNKFDSLPACLTSLTQLKVLHVIDNPILRLPRDIGNMISLEVLDLRDTLVSDIPESISKLRNLRKVWLSSLYLTVDQQQALQKKLPRCEFVYDAPWTTNKNPMQNVITQLQMLQANNEGESVLANLIERLRSSEKMNGKLQ